MNISSASQPSSISLHSEGMIRPLDSMASVPADVRLRLQIDNEINQLGEELNQSHFSDEMTLSIKKWHSLFKTAWHQLIQSLKQERQLNESYLLNKYQVLLNTYIELLQETLTDCIAPYAPLDERAYLGSDQRTYGHMSLTLYLSSVTPEYRNRCPLTPQNPAKFTVTSHSVVEKAVKWLKCRQAHITHLELKKSYDELINQHQVPALPFALNPLQQRMLDIQSFQSRQIQIQMQQRTGLSSSLQQIEEEIKKSLLNRVQQFERTAQLNRENDQAQIEALRKTHDEQTTQIEQAVKKLEKEIKAIQKNNKELKEGLQRVKQEIQLAEQDNIKLQIAINEAREAIKEKQKNWLGELSGALLVIGACAFSTWAIQGLASGCSVLPFPKGAGLSMTIPI